ncbi:Carbamoyl-phosphate synthase large chain [Candidatus Vidania fulgoroideae]|uniref:Carbamoyl-phosphate synthase large chain n=1 Tax=Candidatus Vidania fulgoroideorum TaxID=881286 RepID=A0A346E0H0_9PROT|nr:Carbamoyl-phosphate synthase large chain [Candidatus Vidania fulgoroideae]
MKKIFLIGSGPIIIGQACEFDYSGVQACKVFKNLGYYVILLNNNPASIMTDLNVANKTYIESLDLEVAKKIIRLEKPNYISPSFGGQTSINLVLNLYKIGILKKYKIKVLGTNIKSIINSENRNYFRKIMIRNKIPVPYSKRSKNFKISKLIRKKIVKKNNNEVIIRPSYTLGGFGSGISNSKKDFIKKCKFGLKSSMNNEILIEESLIGWKEIEIEVLIDRKKNFIVVCAIENLDPVGIHTGDSITISPILTLTDKEYQKIRDIGIKVIKTLKIKKCGCNIQFAINNKNGEVRVIEINPRVSRSSALASKITGYPIAKISAKIVLGKLLKNLKNEINDLCCFFEPVIDYVVIKIPKFCNEKFIENTKSFKLGTQMYSVGEIMSIGSSFNEALFKALRSNEDNNFFFIKEIRDRIYFLNYFLNNKSLYYYIFDLLKIGFNPYFLSNITNIDIWYILNLKNIISKENFIKKNLYKKNINRNYFFFLKKFGFSDIFISSLFKVKLISILKLRNIFHIYSSYRRIDTCSGEFNTKTSYLYSSYLGKKKYIKKFINKKILIIGSGPNRIGQGLEFDYCCTHAVKEIKKNKFRAMIMNCNPETISTDYDISDKLFFEPIHYEDLYNIIKNENPRGIIIQFGGQTSFKFLNFISEIKEQKKILGTKIKYIKLSEDRKKFNNLIKDNNLLQPKSISIVKRKKIKNISLSFPLIVRPSYIIGGFKMKKIENLKDLNLYIENTPKKIFPILIDEFLTSAFEYDIDFISNGKKVFIPEIIQHIEKAGIHSGDSTCFFPPFLSCKNVINIKRIVKFLSLKLKIIGLANLQIAIKNDKIYILEVNSRASRTIPFISKGYNINMVKYAINGILRNKIIKNFFVKKNFFFIKEPIFSFTKFPKSDPLLGPEMRSTGEVSCFSKSFEEVFLKSQLSLKFFYIKNIIFYIKKNFLSLFTLKKYISKIGRKIFLIKTRDFLDYDAMNYFNFFKNKFHILIQNKNFNYPEVFFLKFFRIFVKNMLFPLFTTNESIKCFFRCILSFFNNKFIYISSNEVYKKIS